MFLNLLPSPTNLKALFRIWSQRALIFAYQDTEFKNLLGMREKYFLCYNTQNINMKQESLTLGEIAYKKIVFHCLRYPSSKVYGALVKQTNSSVISNAYPLFHTAINSPGLSLALDLVQSNLAANEQIAGFYEFTEDSSPLVFTRISESNQQLKNMPVVKVTCSAKEFTFTNEDNKITTPEFKIVEKDLIEGKHRLIIDMDAHLDTIQFDFRNLYVQ